MIKTVIFDFGDVFINLDKEAPYIEMKKLGIHSFSEEMIENNKLYETGKIDTSAFLDYYQKAFPNISKSQLSEAWNSIILDFPEYRLEYIEALATSKKYQLILLSNTNDLHIEKVIENITLERFQRFKNCFDAFYLSQEIHLRKPNSDIYNFVLDTHNINPNESLFIDDTKENTETAKKLGIHTWNIIPKKEDVVDLFLLKKDIF
ncbi:MAG: epoxide hydrolase-like predicted phosphatase [Flavobacteriaceae bacterium]|jgi:epoxide hydrolase-like predicted phosphatase